MSVFPEEPLDSPLGYFPGQLNRILNNGRWTIIRKLGWGPRSSCWLAIDPKDHEDIEAIKIYNVAASEEPRSTNERDILHKMYGSRAIGRGKCLPLHIFKKVACEVVGPCALFIKRVSFTEVNIGQPLSNMLPPEASYYLYQEGHTIQEFLSQNPSIPSEDVRNIEGTTYHIVKSQPLNTFDLTLETTAIDFARVGFDLSNFSRARIQSENVPLDPSSTFFPPEASIDGAKVDTKADICMLGCTIYTLVIGRPPFGDSPGPLSRDKDEEITANIKIAISATNAMSPQDAKKTMSVGKRGFDVLLWMVFGQGVNMLIDFSTLSVRV
ncbi:hypothetical protein CPB84DRAFT_1881078 [Gymnopilus junonius]|uniref:Protein kinase domain-containing protein n=1 Tax=Gymnopilus junonius TaxID=109634 RepID=A0A9P5NBW9_GYMJU|nr:hypothetical protein CPB84DRAFT_1881078 [Gymnopilus junonius]